ncbi:hypothetical protein [Micromonospora sp. NPDC005237]|uniref:hypothetical protein n=1 Tax=Micromonospora sp. NPDC005237 TaxID=3155113 RepID=UPI0033BB8FCB
MPAAYDHRETRIEDGRARPRVGQRLLNDGLDAVLADGDQYEKDVVATGFLESLLAAADRGFDLRRVWHELGPRSQQYCRDWNAFAGVRSPDFMRPA